MADTENQQAVPTTEQAVQAADLYIDHDPMRRDALIRFAVRQAGIPRRDGSHRDAARVIGQPPRRSSVRTSTPSSEI